MRLAPPLLLLTLFTAPALAEEGRKSELDSAVVDSVTPSQAVLPPEAPHPAAVDLRDNDFLITQPLVARAVARLQTATAVDAKGKRTIAAGEPLYASDWRRIGPPLSAGFLPFGREMSTLWCARYNAGLEPARYCFRDADGDGRFEAVSDLREGRRTGIGPLQFRPLEPPVAYGVRENEPYDPPQVIGIAVDEPPNFESNLYLALTTAPRGSRPTGYGGSFGTDTSLTVKAGEAPRSVSLFGWQGRLDGWGKDRSQWSGMSGALHSGRIWVEPIYDAEGKVRTEKRGILPPTEYPLRRLRSENDGLGPYPAADPRDAAVKR